MMSLACPSWQTSYFHKLKTLLSEPQSRQIRHFERPATRIKPISERCRAASRVSDLINDVLTGRESMTFRALGLAVLLGACLAASAQTADYGAAIRCGALTGADTEMNPG